MDNVLVTPMHRRYKGIILKAIQQSGDEITWTDESKLEGYGAIWAPPDKPITNFWHSLDMLITSYNSV